MLATLAPMEAIGQREPRPGRPLPLERASFAQRAAAVAAAPGYAGWLMAFLLAACAYAAFANGAIAGDDEARLQVGVAATVVFGGIGLGAGALAWGRAPLAWCGAALVALFALWSALSLDWSVAPDDTWLAVNRAVTYAAVIGLALVAGAAIRFAPRIVAIAIPLLVLPVALFALAGKLAPELHLAGISFDHTERFQRLREPIGYWNALGLLCVMATPTCIWAAADRDWRDGARTAALLVLDVLLVTIALTYSRGAVLAFLGVAAVMVAAGPNRLRRVAVVGVAVLAAVPSVAFAFGRHDLTTAGLPASQRADDGAILTVILTLGLAALVVVARLALAAERRVEWRPRHTRLARTAIAAAAILVLLAGTAALASSDRGIGGTVSHQWHEFKRVKASSRDPGRLVSVNGSNRWVWWSEAMGAFSDKPVKGWGAGSFPVLHYLYRNHEAPVRSTHSVELQFLSETGLVGAALGLGGLALLFAAAAQGARRARGAERSARLALVAVAAAWAVHSVYDWDWEIPAVTLPALIAAAIAAMPYGGGRQRGELVPARSRRDLLPGWFAAGAAALAGAALAISVVLPALSDSRRLDAFVTASRHTPAATRDGATQADLARRLNPLSIDPLLAEATIFSGGLRFDLAERSLYEAVRRQPESYRGWQALTAFLGTFDAPGPIERALRRWSLTDPLTFEKGPPPQAGLAYPLELPPSRSPTAYGTPLPQPAAPALPAGIVPTAP